MADDLDIGDSRVEFMAAFILKTLKIKADKWQKMYGIEDNKIIILEYLEKSDQILLVFILTPAGGLIVTHQYPQQLKGKACYFAKKNKENIPKDSNLKEVLIYGDLSYSPLDQLSAILDEVMKNLFSIFIE